MTTCRVTRVNEVESIAVGPQDVPAVCGQLATVQVLVHGVVHEMCDRCADETVERFGGKKLDPVAALATLDEVNTTLLSAAQELDAYPDIAEWLEQCSIQLRQLVQTMQGV